MFITKQNKILYDTKNFDTSKNVYAVLIDNVKVKANTDKIESYDILNINIFHETFWMYFPIMEGSIFKTPYKIVYGHFYNNSDMFLYKDIHSGKIIGHSIKKTYIEKLYYNKNKLLYNKSYKTLVQQLDHLKEKSKEDYQSKQLTINYIYDDETIEFNNSEKYISTYYDNECLILTYTEKTKIIT